jgi:hypothetical protein
VNIRLAYQLWGSDDVVWITLTPEKYFDPLEPGETYEADGVPRYNHTWRYLSVPRERLKWSLERREGTRNDTTFRTQYMAGGKTWMTHRIDPDGFEELIHYTQISATCCHIVRTRRRPTGAWTVSLISVIHDLPGGKQESKNYEEPWTFAQVNEFARKHPTD